MRAHLSARCTDVRVYTLRINNERPRRLALLNSPQNSDGFCILCQKNNFKTVEYISLLRKHCLEKGLLLKERTQRIFIPFRVTPMGNRKKETTNLKLCEYVRLLKLPKKSKRFTVVH